MITMSMPIAMEIVLADLFTVSTGYPWRNKIICIRGEMGMEDFTTTSKRAGRSVHQRQPGFPVFPRMFRQGRCMDGFFWEPGCNYEN
jgi:hypothetical protein